MAAATEDDVPDDCTTCGACCFATHDRHVPLTGADHARLLPAERARLAMFDGVRAFLRVEGRRCAALTVAGGRFLCSVYERRPQVCRDLERGGPACRFELGAKRALARAAALESPS